MEFDIRMPQLTEVQAQLDELFNHVDALHRKLDDLALTAAAPGPVAPPEAPAPVVQKELPTIRPRRRGAAAAPAATPAASANGSENVGDTDEENEDTLRARVEFEAKRTTRQFGIGGTRAAISRVADGAMRVDDVPAARLPAVLSALQAL